MINAYPNSVEHLQRMFRDLRYYKEPHPLFQQSPADLAKLQGQVSPGLLRMPPELILCISDFTSVLDIPSLRLAGSRHVRDYLEIRKKPKLDDYITSYGRDGASRVGLQEHEVWHIAAILGDLKLMVAMWEKEPWTVDHMVAKAYVFGAREWRDSYLSHSQMDLLASFSTRGRTAMHHAAEAGNDKVIIFLATAGVSVDCLDASKCTPLYYAAKGNHMHTIKLLLKMHARPETMSGGRTLLHEAASFGNLELARDQLAAGHDPGWKRKGLDSPIENAVSSGQVAVFKLLQSWHTQIHGYPFVNDEMTYLAAMHGHLGMVKALLEYGPRMLGTAWKAPLPIAARYGHTDVVRHLLPFYCTKQGRTTILDALYDATASQSSAVDSVAILLREVRHFFGMDATLAQALLLRASTCRRGDIVRHLIEIECLHEHIELSDADKIKYGLPPGSEFEAALLEEDDKKLAARVFDILGHIGGENIKPPKTYSKDNEVWSQLPKLNQSSSAPG